MHPFWIVHWAIFFVCILAGPKFVGMNSMTQADFKKYPVTNGNVLICIILGFIPVINYILLACVIVCTIGMTWDLCNNNDWASKPFFKRSKE